MSCPTPTDHGRRLACLLLALALAGCSEARRPNVVLIVIDTLRADHLSTYGYPWETSPHMDELGERGAVFLDCMAQSSWTMPSMMSLMTSEPIFHTIWKLPQSLPVLGEQFQRAGYRTGAVVANSVLHDDAGYARGYDSWELRPTGGRKWNASDVNTRAYDFLDGQGDEPFFLWLHYYDPHYPYSPPEVPLSRDAATVFSEAELATIDAVIAAADPTERAFLAGQREDLARAVDGYDGEITFTDRYIGELLDRLERDGLVEHTIIAIASDHGETLFARPEHPKRLEEVRQSKTGERRVAPMLLSDYLQDEHGYWAYQELVHTPLILAGPGIVPGQRIDALVSNLDLAPTLVELAGLEWSGRPRGRSLAPYLGSGRPPPPADVALSACYETFTARAPDGRKFVMPHPPNEMKRLYGLEKELFDLTSDPEERHPLPLDGTARDMERLLWDARGTDAFKPFSADQPDQATIDALIEGGYIEGPQHDGR